MITDDKVKVLIENHTHANNTYTAKALTDLLASRERERELEIALHDAINRPKGVVPVSAEKFYNQNKALTKEEVKCVCSRFYKGKCPVCDTDKEEG